mmetsp:Transcript_22935/g.55290  ORF Transcript_22935/g.55290 Transcript_22935/m.55290 type:complete len:99 (+) Transcript_22935:206-502(+)
MGSSSSKQKDQEVVCIDCDRKTQKDLPSDDSSSASNGMPCEQVYTTVGKLTPCRSVNEFIIMIIGILPQEIATRHRGIGSAYLRILNFAIFNAIAEFF